LELRRKNGTTLIANLNARWLLLGDEKVVFTAFLDITDRKLADNALEEAKREMEILASLDGLTGVANRRFFDERLEEEWKRASRAESHISLLIADIDYFKSYNDANGHLAGDECLKKVAKTLWESVRRPSDLLARYGGEEFAALLPNTEIGGALRLAETMNSRIQAMSVIHPDSRAGNRLTVSIGVASMVPQRNSSQLDLIKAADDALYKAKREGRNCVRTSSASVSRRDSQSGRSHVA
jgi:diguanylate cyclase (GGDEF)-like protein